MSAAVQNALRKGGAPAIWDQMEVSISTKGGGGTGWVESRGGSASGVQVDAVGEF